MAGTAIYGPGKPSGAYRGIWVSPPQPTAMLAVGLRQLAHEPWRGIEGADGVALVGGGAIKSSDVPTHRYVVCPRR
jgi:hypothetical protein